MVQSLSAYPARGPKRNILLTAKTVRPGSSPLSTGHHHTRSKSLQNRNNRTPFRGQFNRWIVPPIEIKYLIIIQDTSDTTSKPGA